LRELGDTWLNGGDWQKAKNYYNRALKLAKKIGNQTQVAWAIRDLGWLAKSRLNWDETLERYQQALKIFEELKQPLNQITVWSDIGNVNRLAKRWARAEEAYQKGLRISREIGDRIKEARRLSDLGLLAVDQQQWDEALERYQQALKIFEEFKQTTNQILIWNNIGDVNRLTKQWTKAEEAYRKGLKLSREVGYRVNEAWCLHSLGLLAADQQQWDEASERHQQALKIFEELKQPANQVTRLHNIEDLNDKLQTDHDLIRACRAGDARAWGRLLDKYERVVFSISLNYGLTTDDAADITQITFTILLQNLDTLPDGIHLASWLATVARRHTWRLLARNRREAVDLEEDLAGDETLNGIVDPSERRELAEWLNYGLSTLDERCRKLLLALYFDAEQPSYAQLAEQLKMPVGSIAPTRSRCLEQLRQNMSAAELPAAAHSLPRLGWLP
jgi:RNA polymerase sigma factor (sigma-70 family)